MANWVTWLTAEGWSGWHVQESRDSATTVCGLAVPAVPVSKPERKTALLDIRCFDLGSGPAMDTKPCPVCRLRLDIEALEKTLAICGDNEALRVVREATEAALADKRRELEAAC